MIILAIFVPRGSSALFYMLITFKYFNPVNYFPDMATQFLSLPLMAIYGVLCVIIIMTALFQDIEEMTFFKK